jgi:hypothetical protein
MRVHLSLAPTSLLIPFNINPSNPEGRGRAIAQTVSSWFPTAAVRVRAWSGHVGFVVDKVAVGHFSPSTSGSLANHSTKFSILIINRARYNRPI